MNIIIISEDTIFIFIKEKKKEKTTNPSKIRHISRLVRKFFREVLRGVGVTQYFLSGRSVISYLDLF